jgi:hypothetical protein
MLESEEMGGSESGEQASAAGRTVLRCGDSAAGWNALQAGRPPGLPLAQTDTAQRHLKL